MIETQMKDAVFRHLGPMKETRKGWQRRDCMLCHTQGHGRDTRGRFGIKVDPDGSIIVNCFNCDFDAIWRPGETISKKFQTFMQEVGISRTNIDKLAFAAFDYSVRSGHGTAAASVKLEADPTTKWVPMKFPKGTHSLQYWAENGCDDKDFIQVLEYAVGRNFIKLDELYWSTQRYQQLNRRLILPFYYQGQLVGYTGRYYKDLQNKKVPKYLNTMPDGYVYNLDHQLNDPQRKFVILAEGVFDAWVVDGISTMNSGISGDQIDIINRLGKRVIVLPDRDKDGELFVKTALEQGWSVAFPKWERHIKDAAKAAETYGRVMTVKSILDSAIQGKFEIELKWGMNVGNKGLY